MSITYARINRKALAMLGHHVSASGAEGAAPNLMELSGAEFEVRITNLLERMGFRTELTRVTGDGGIDIVAVLDRPIVGGRYLVQCKRFADGSPVGAPMVREFYGAFVADRSAIKGLFITTSAFTVQAREFTQTLPIELIDGARLSALLKEYAL
jgi:restriction system protein